MAGCGEGRMPEGSLKECDDGNNEDGDGCSGSCRIECGRECGGWTADSADTCSAVCGDGQLGGEEACDDGNGVDGDGCSSTCQVEEWWTCTSATCRTSWCSS